MIEFAMFSIGVFFLCMSLVAIVWCVDVAKTWNDKKEVSE